MRKKDTWMAFDCSAFLHAQKVCQEVPTFSANEVLANAKIYTIT
jgi:hypothetical protein